MNTQRWILQLEHPRRSSRLEAIRRLAQNPSPVLVPALLACLDPGSFRERLEAIAILVQIGDRSVIPALSARLPGTSGEERTMLRRALHDLGGGRAALRTSYLEEIALATNRRRRLEAFFHVVRLGHTKASRDALRSISQDPADQLRHLAIEELLNWGVPMPRDEALTLLEDTNPYMRIRGVRMLGANAPPELHRRITQVVLNCDVPSDRQTSTLVEIRSFGPLIEQLKTAHWEQRLYLSRVLADAGVIEAIPALSEGLAAADGASHRWLDLRRAFIRALGKLDSPDAIPPIERALQDRDKSVRQIAARELERRGIAFTPPTEVTDPPDWPRPYTAAGVDPALWPALLADDPAAWLAHATWLEGQNDPRATMVREQTKLTDAYDLSAPHSLIVAEFDLGAEQLRFRPMWLRGYWHALGSWTSVRSEQTWDSLLSHSSALFLRDFSIRWIEPEVLLRLLERHRPPLRRFYWQDEGEPVDFDPIFHALPHVRQLCLWRSARFQEGPAGLTDLSINTEVDAGMASDIIRFAEAGGFASLQSLEISSTDNFEPWAVALLAGSRPRKLVLSTGGKAKPLLRALVEWPGLATVEDIELEGLWPAATDLNALITALEARTTPLKRYASSGKLPSKRAQARLRHLALNTQITG